MIINYLKRNRCLFIFLSVIFIIGLLFGLIIYNKLDNSTKIDIINSISNIKEDIINNKISLFFIHLFIISIDIILAYTFIGYLFSVFHFFLEGLSISVSICFLMNIFKFKGLLFGILYNLLFKSLYLVILLFIFIKLGNISLNTFYNLIYRRNNYRSYEFKSIIVFLIIILINDIFIYTFGTFLLKFMINML